VSLWFLLFFVLFGALVPRGNTPHPLGTPLKRGIGEEENEELKNLEI